MAPLRVQSTVPIYARAEDKEGIRQAFPYLVDPELSTGGGAVPALSFFTIHDYEAFEVRVGSL